MAPQRQGKSWLLTIFNAKEQDAYLKICEEDINVETFSFQDEVCPETGKEHLQAFLFFKRKVDFRNLKAKLATAHIKQAPEPRGAFEYCNKPKTRKPGGRFGHGDCPWKSGPIGTRGWRSYQEYSRDHSWIECTEFWPELRVHETVMRKIWDRYHASSLAKPQIEIYIGPSGVGKSTIAKAKLGVDHYHHTGTHWWMGYHGQTKVLIDDLNPGQFTRAFLLNLMDNPEGIIGEVKGGEVNIRWDHLIITTQYPIEEWFTGKKSSDADKSFAFYRRAQVMIFCEDGPQAQAADPNNTKGLLGRVERNLEYFGFETKKAGEPPFSSSSISKPDTPELKRARAQTPEQLDAEMEGLYDIWNKEEGWVPTKVTRG